MVNSGKLNIAIIGTRGIPASYGGFETFAEEISKALTDFGHQVTVYGRKKFDFKGAETGQVGAVRTVKTATIFHKYAETPLNSLTACFHAIRQNYDVILVCNAANSPFTFQLKLAGIPFAVNVDGIERKRAKWNMLGKLWYLLGEKTSVWFADKIIADADIIADYYREYYQLTPPIIRYGARHHATPPGETLKKFHLTAKNYILYVSRIEPENNALGTIQAYVKANPDIPLVVVGDAPYSEEYKQKLREAANDQVIFTGYQFGDAYKELRSNCLIYIQATEVGGTHPALVEAIVAGNCVVANDVPEHREVLREAGLYYRYNDFDHLAEIIIDLLQNREKISEHSEAALKLAETEFDWIKIARDYESLLSSLVKH